MFFDTDRHIRAGHKVEKRWIKSRNAHTQWETLINWPQNKGRSVKVLSIPVNKFEKYYLYYISILNSTSCYFAKCLVLFYWWNLTSEVSFILYLVPSASLCYCIIIFIIIYFNFIIYSIAFSTRKILLVILINNIYYYSLKKKSQM